MRITENRETVARIVTETMDIVQSPLFTEFKPTMAAKMELLRQAAENAGSPQETAEIAERVLKKIFPLLQSTQATSENIAKAAAAFNDHAEAGHIDFDGDEAVQMAKRLETMMEQFIQQRQALLHDADTLILALLPIDNVRPC